MTLLFILCIIPFASAVQITEIMYDLDGSDEGYEWVEVYNNGEDLDFCSYKFYEADKNHRLSSETCQLGSDEYAIIADKPENLDFDSFDSVFSLSNMGEELCIHNSNKESLDCVTYSSSQGASGDGKSLQFVDGEWCVGNPTPGEENQCDLAEDELIQEEPREEKQSEEITPKEQDEEIKSESEEQVFEPTNNLEKETPTQQKTQEVKVIPEPVQITSNIIYQSEAQSASNLPVLMLLAVSIILNVVLIASAIRK